MSDDSNQIYKHMECQKHLFSLDDDVHYLNCAYKAPLLKSAEQACLEALHRDRNPQKISSQDFFSQIEAIRSLFARIICDKAENIALIPSTSYGFSSVLQNVKGKSQGNAVTNLYEFPSGYYCLERWCNKHQQKLIVAQEYETSISNWNNHIIDAINEHTSVVLISSVHWMNGYKFDLQAIGEKCEKYNAIFIVDGTQSVGALPMNVNEFKIDALVCAAYKWLFGPYSTAISYIHPRFHNGIPIEESWMNRANASKFESLTNYTPAYTPGAGRYNVGESSNFILAPILYEGLKQIISWNPQTIQEYTKQLAQPLFSFLETLGVNRNHDFDFSSHLFALPLPDGIEPQLFKENLTKHKVIVSQRGNNMRISLNMFNEISNLQALQKAMLESMR